MSKLITAIGRIHPVAFMALVMIIALASAMLTDGTL